MAKVENEVVEVVEGTEVQGTEEAKPKRKRKAPVKIEKTGGEIAEAIAVLKVELGELETAMSQVGTDNVVYPIVHAALEAKQAEVQKALDAKYRA